MPRFSLPEDMKTRQSSSLLSLALVLLLAACAGITPRYSQPADFVEPMNKLSLAVDAELHNPFRTNAVSGCQLLEAAMAEKPELRTAFQTATLMITNRNRNAVVLLLNPKHSNIAWIECATWSSALTRLHYLSNPPSPAWFTIDLP
jgi:hypothetical protein